MKTTRFLQKDSIATQLIKVVFAWYCAVAIAITASQMVMEYAHTKTQIKQELAINQQIFEPVLSTGLWDLDQQQIQATINGMIAIPIVSGVKIEQSNTILNAAGSIIDKDGLLQHYDNKGEKLAQPVQNNADLITYSFDVQYTFRGQPRVVGTATLYTHSQVVFDRVQLGFVLLVVNSIIKTLALWVLFFYIGRKILLDPLNTLVSAIKEVNINTVDTFKVDLQSKHKNELTLIEDAFSQMLNKLAKAKNQIIHLNSNLESKVQERTLQLKIAKEDAELASQAKSVFMSRINHELRTPLNAIMGCTQILNSMLDEPKYEKQQSLLKHTQDAAEHLLMLFEDILEVVVKDSQELNIPLHNCDLNEIIHASVTMVKVEAEEKQVSFDVEHTMAVAYGNESRLKQVMIQLLTNAIRYNNQDGHIAITIEPYGPHQIAIKVKDTGVGIREEELNEIFDPLNRLSYAEDNEIDGAGIGLSVVKTLVEKMNGQVSVSSTVGKGSEFVVILPKAKKEVHDDDLDGF